MLSRKRRGSSLDSSTPKRPVDSQAWKDENARELRNAASRLETAAQQLQERARQLRDEAQLLEVIGAQ